jgi:hypothetical protein
MTRNDPKELLKEQLKRLIPRDRSELERFRERPALHSLMEAVLRVREATAALAALPAPVEAVSASTARGSAPRRSVQLKALVQGPERHREIDVVAIGTPVIGRYGTLDLRLQLPADMAEADCFELHCVERLEDGAVRHVGEPLEDVRPGDLVSARFPLSPEQRDAWSARLERPADWPFRFLLTPGSGRHV